MQPRQLQFPYSLHGITLGLKIDEVICQLGRPDWTFSYDSLKTNDGIYAYKIGKDNRANLFVYFSENDNKRVIAVTGNLLALGNGVLIKNGDSVSFVENLMGPSQRKKQGKYNSLVYENQQIEFILSGDSKIMAIGMGDENLRTRFFWYDGPQQKLRCQFRLHPILTSDSPTI